MNWDAIGAVGEILGAVAVVVTLYYLAAQIRHATEANKAQRFQDLVDGISDITNEIARKENAEIIAKGFRDFYSLKNSERLTFDNLIFNLFNYVEAVIRNHQSGMVDEHTMENLSSWMCSRYFPYPGIRQWWEVTENQFPPYMREWVLSAFSRTEAGRDFHEILAAEDE